MHFKLIGSSRSRAMRALWMLEEVGCEYDYSPDFPRTPEVMAVNPTGRIPALIVDDKVVTDSVAIVTFLADAYGVATFPAGTVERAQQDALTQMVVEELDGPLWVSSKHKWVLPKELRNPEAVNAAHWEFGVGISRLADALGEGPYLMGDTFTVPDLIAAHCLAWARLAEYPAVPEQIAAYGKACRARPAFKAALAKGAKAEA